MITNNSKLQRLINKSLKSANRSNNPSQIFKALELNLKIQNQEKQRKSLHDQLAQLTLDDIPMEILHKWSADFLNKVEKDPQLHAVYQEIIKSLPTPP